MLYDSERFTIESYRTIERSSQHVYYSCLPFAPRESELYKAYGTEAKTSVNVLMGQRLEWSRSLATPTGHKDQVGCVAISSDGKRIASGSGDAAIRVWDARSGMHLLTLTGHSGNVR